MATDDNGNVLPPSLPTDHFDGYQPARPADNTQALLEAYNQQAKTNPRFDNLDGFKNVLTGIGDFMRDKTFGGNPNGPDFEVQLMSGTEIENRWRGSDLGGRIVETIPEEMTRAGWEIQVQPSAEDGRKGKEPTFSIQSDEDGQSLAEELDQQLQDIKAPQAFKEALNYERAFGGAGILVGADDGESDMLKPLDVRRVKRIRYLNAFRGGWDGELIAWTFYADPRSPRFGEPETYMLRNLGVPIFGTWSPGNSKALSASAASLVSFVHESRLIIFPGQAVSHLRRVQMRGWGDSIFTRINKVLGDYDQSWGGIANLLTDWSQGVMNIDGLSDMMASTDSSDQSAMVRRAMMIQMSRSICRVMMLDKDESFKRETTPITGVPELLQQFALRLAAAAEMPVSLLMGQAPAGLSATGASDIRFFYDKISSRQRDRLVPQLRRLLKLIMRSKESPTGSIEPAKWGISMKSLWQPTDLEMADLRFKQAQTDQIYYNMQAITPEEITVSRFGGAKWSAETVIDFEGRKAMAKMVTPPPKQPPASEKADGAKKLRKGAKKR